MRVSPIASMSRLSLLASLLLFGSLGLLNATDSMPASATDWGGMMRAASNWLRLVDEEKYVESFAAAAAPFREGITVEDWRRNHVSMRRDLGAVVRRDEMKAQFLPSNDWTDAMTFTIWTPTRFEKMHGGERLTMMQESSEWKVAGYTINREAQ